jgi:hypothetical protein
MPRPAPQPKQGEAPASPPTTIAGLIGSWFGGSKAEAAPSASEKDVVARSASTDLAAKPKQQAAPVRAVSGTASAPAPVHTASAGAAPVPRESAPKAVPEVVRAPASGPPSQAAKAEPPQAPEIRTAYSTPPASNNGLLTGAQPVVPAGSFNSFR